MIHNLNQGVDHLVMLVRPGFLAKGNEVARADEGASEFSYVQGDFFDKRRGDTQS